MVEELRDVEVTTRYKSVDETGGGEWWKRRVLVWLELLTRGPPQSAMTDERKGAISCCLFWMLDDLQVGQRETKDNQVDAGRGLCLCQGLTMKGHV